MISEQNSRKVRVQLYPTKASQHAINCAEEIKGGRIETLYTKMITEPEGPGCGRRGRSTRFFCRVTAEAVIKDARPAEICGLAVFDGSIARLPQADQDGRIEAELKHEHRTGRGLAGIPPAVLDRFDNELYFGGEGRSVYLLIDPPESPTA